ncbi:uncharacterized protein MELLADRAFT_61044 [Melampsora larici-populina 98AG31]|uniref:Uncharacterized protein n=1 Tax=Melampsora larici-populina (strain 98AG31 / pathotype 3-4-7) TaxID=747676 RepID=F4RDD5_MELLP|nr:uncharacterized protein MELLADRAFT_61044 [Melampsora larici-populina 98AG31]EGG09383.1 hypothetical protein MELLADRAFT_61044 [Melampsora larici-populina 98AG31]
MRSSYLIGSKADDRRASSQRVDRPNPGTNSGASVTGSVARRRHKAKALTTAAGKGPADSNSSPPRQPADSLKRRQSPSPFQSQPAAKHAKSLVSASEEVPSDNFNSSGISHPNGAGGQPGDNFQLLTPAERAFIDGITSSAGLSNRHAEYAREMGEVFGDDFCHLALCGNVACTQSQLSNLSDQVSQMAQQMETLHGDITNKFRILMANTRNASQGIPSTSANTASTEVARTAVVSEWKVSRQLKALLSEVSVELMPKANLQSYTELEDGSKNFLQRSLFNRVRVRVAEEQKEDWIALHLPKQIRGVNDGEGVKKTQASTPEKRCTYWSVPRQVTLMETLTLHKIQLLTNVHNQKNGPVKVVPVPSLMALWHRIALKCGLITESVDQIAAWSSVNEATRGRIAYLVSHEIMSWRRDARRPVFDKPLLVQIYGPRWTNGLMIHVKKKRSHFEQGLLVHAFIGVIAHQMWLGSFYDIIYQNDQEIFNGKRGWGEIRKNYALALPTDAEIMEGISGGGVEGAKALGNAADDEVLGDQGETSV